MRLGILPKLVHNLFSKPMTVKFPHESIPIPDGYRGEHQYPKKYPKIDLGKCCFCGLCEDICPKDAIRLTKNVFLSTFDKSNVIKYPQPNNEGP
jgi:formate hydrogenlyase subunit 6/NADH:ubiquinone oxidoreductase subunit I